MFAIAWAQRWAVVGGYVGGVGSMSKWNDGDLSGMNITKENEMEIINQFNVTGKSIIRRGE
jgi:hypothetical protein